MDSVLQRCLESTQFSVDGNAQTEMPGVDSKLRLGKRPEVLDLSKTTGERAQAETQQAPSSGAFGKLEVQLAAAQPIALTDLQALRQIGVVADEHERCAMRKRLPIHGQDDRQKGIAAQRAHQRPGEGGPFAEAETRLLALAVADQIDVELDARVVEEEVTVDLADIDLSRISGGDRSQGGQRVRRNARISREMDGAAFEKP